MWSGKLPEAEHEYLEILAVVQVDPDDWMGSGYVYSGEGRAAKAKKALDSAVELDPKRGDLREARGRALQAADEQREAKQEFHRALELDPNSTQARAGLLSLRGEPKQGVRVGVNADLFSFADANHDEGLSLTSQWTSHWGTSVASTVYRRGGTEAEKFMASFSGKLPRWGALTVGGAAAHDNNVIPKNEAFFDYDQGWRLGGGEFVRRLELVYGQHWYWYTTARILAINGTALFYLPHDWTWSLGLTEARSHFSGTGVEWRPSGVTRPEFPISSCDTRRLAANV